MSSSVLYMAMSLDGFIAGPNDEPGNPGGDGFLRLHEWGLNADGEMERPAGPAGVLFDEFNASGAVLSGRRTAEQVNHWGGATTACPSSWSATGRPAPRWRLSAGDVRQRRDRECDGPGEGRGGGQGRVRARRLHRAAGARGRVLDELEISQVPVLFGAGRRLFDLLPSRVELEVVRVIDTPEATHLRYRVRR